MIARLCIKPDQAISRLTTVTLAGILGTILVPEVYTDTMFLALASIVFVAFLAFIAIAPQQGIQLFLFLTWAAMGLTVLWTLVKAVDKLILS